ncbi:MAG: hypothetical protein SCM11_10990 [Bacillota bacterium]|nr:hypothetical protein [Bacillota bacterium]
MSSAREKTTAKNSPVIVALDGWYGVDWPQIIKAAQSADLEKDICYINFLSVFRNIEEIKAYKKPFLTEDPGFGYVNHAGEIRDLIDPERLTELREKLQAACTSSVIMLYGSGAAIEDLADLIDITVYFDKTRQPILWQMWDRQLVPFGMEHADENYSWKEYYYCDYYLLDHQKTRLYDRMDFWVEAIDAQNLKLLPRSAYDEIIRTLLLYPIKEIKIYQPGPWGAYRYRELFDVPGLECNAWNELAGPELGIAVDLGHDIYLEMPMLNLMQYQPQFLGARLAEAYPGLFPLDVWLDDGYFPEKTPIERTAMPIHNHPSTDYVRRHFNEPMGRYETYYICEAYEDACTIMGYKDDVDLEKWEALCRDSENLREIKNWRDYLCVWDSNIGDLYLIPPGTAHGHGGNQMVLEMDTCPSIAATEYSFFQYDYARNSWNDDKKTMTGKPMKMHLEHGFDNEKWRRSEWVKNHLLARPKVVSWDNEAKFDRYPTLPEMPFEIERYHFYQQASGSTQGKLLHILTLTIGNRIIIRSKTDPSRSTEIERFQSVLVPACFEDYELLSTDSSFCEVVLFRWKDI